MFRTRWWWLVLWLCTGCSARVASGDGLEAGTENGDHRGARLQEWIVEGRTSESVPLVIKSDDGLARFSIHERLDQATFRFGDDQLTVKLGHDLGEGETLEKITNGFLGTQSLRERLVAEVVLDEERELAWDVVADPAQKAIDALHYELQRRSENEAPHPTSKEMRAEMLDTTAKLLKASIQTLWDPMPSEANELRATYVPDTCFETRQLLMAGAYLVALNEAAHALSREDASTDNVIPVPEAEAWFAERASARLLCLP